MKLAVSHRQIGWNVLWTLVLLLMALAPPHGYALDPAKSLFQYNCQTWRRQSGLPANGVNAIAQSKDGYLWLGTPNGLVRFDGSDFTLLDLGQSPGLRSRVATGLSTSSRGGFWFGLERSAFGYCDGAGVSLLGQEAWGGANLNVHSVLETREGDLWVAAETLAARLSQQTRFDIILNTPDSQSVLRFDVTALYQDALGRVWLGTARRGLFYWLNGILTRFPDPALDDLTIRSLAEDRRGRLWVGTDLGLLCYDAAFARQPLPFPWHPTRALLADAQGALWAGTSGGGLVRFLDGAPTQLRRADGLADDFVMALAEDKEGCLWVGTRNGLSQLSDVKFPTFGKAEGLTAEVNVAVCASRQGGLWVATSQGFTHFDGAAHHYSADIGLRHPYINGIFEARDGDLYLINGAMDIEVFARGKIVARYPNRTWPLTLAEDAQGVVVAVAGDLFRVGTNSFAPYRFAGGQKPPIYWIWHLAAARDGSLWVASDQGICRVKDGAFTLWNKAKGLADDKALWVCEDPEGVIWAGLETGLARVKDGQVRNIRREDGLFDSLVYAIVPDDHGNLWIDSGQGFFRVSRQALNDFADGKAPRVACTPFTGLDAVKSAEKNQQKASGCKTRDGRIWFPTAQGVVMINPTNIPANPVPPKVHLQSVRANGRELGPRDTLVPPGKGELDFHYVGVGYIAPLKIQYRHKLDGYDKDWIVAGTRRSAYYTNLKPGRYRFEVQACNEDGVWNTSRESRAIELPPHYYQTWWFRTISAALLLAGLMGVSSWRVRRWRRRQQHLQEAHDLLERRVRERTAELAQSNTLLKNEIAERQRMEVEIARAHKELLLTSRQAGQAEVASSVLHNVGNVLNSVNVSAAVITERLGGLQLSNLAKVADMIQGQGADLDKFLSADAKGRHVTAYLRGLARYLVDEQRALLREIEDLTRNIDHIKEVVSMQQAYARVAGVTEKVAAAELVETALRMRSGASARRAIDLVRAYDPVPPLTVDTHKVAQVLVNLLQNAQQACEESGRPDPRIGVRIEPLGDAQVRIAVTDNGVGIAAENLTRIFSHGFTTRKNGHGFGLHSGALAARELGGRLSVQSEGIGQGATFLLDLPLEPATAGDAPTPQSLSVPTGET